MGCLFAWFFHRAGIDAVIYEKSPAAAEALANGLIVRQAADGGQPEERTPVRASSGPSILSECRAILIFVKSYATEDAARDIAPHLSKDAVLVTLQNGLGNVEILEGLLPKTPLVYGTTTIGGYMEGLSTVVRGGPGGIVIGGADAAALSFAAGLFKEAGLDTTITDDPRKALWKKAIINAAINPLGALTGLTNGGVAESGQLRCIQKAVVRECSAAARAEGMALEEGALGEEVLEICRKTAPNRCSMLQDLEAGRQTEIESICGPLLLAGERHGIEMPCTMVLHGLVTARQKKTGVAPGDIKWD